MAKKTNYRRFYKEYYGIDFGSDFCIHHLDFNRENNDINNLLLIPKKVHGQFHFACHFIEKTKKDFYDPKDLHLGNKSYQITMGKLYFTALEEMDRFATYKMLKYSIRPEGVISTKTFNVFPQ